MMKTFWYTVELSTDGDATPVAEALVDADKRIRKSNDYRGRFRFKRDEHRGNRLTLALTLSADSWGEASSMGDAALRELADAAGIRVVDADNPAPATAGVPLVESQGFELASA